MNVAILSIGDELIGGRIVDTNAAFLSSQVALLGGMTVLRMTVGDRRGDIVDALRRLSKHAEIVLVTGGLGPTPDDLTRWAAADLVDGGEVVDDSEAMECVRNWCSRVGLPPTEARTAVAQRPPSSQFMSNDCGTAPGIRMTYAGADMFMLPGPPTEMRSMWHRHVGPALEASAGLRRAPIEVIAAGLTEVQAADQLGSLLDRGSRPRLGIRVGRGLIRVSLEDPDGKVTAADMEKVHRKVRDLLSPWTLPEGSESLSEAVGEALQGRGWTMATAESCTGGGIGAAITAQPGSSVWYVGGWVTYTNEMKCRELGVPPELFHGSGPGAVSEEVVLAMAAGARAKSGANLAIAVSGIAGPNGGTESKPVGTVWVGLASCDSLEARLIRAPGDRDQVRAATIATALQWVRWRAEGINSFLQWEAKR
ncbi:MAG: CinA family nicotinamide mononucleotide deamidase-related protein [Planctomycetes bacterium]|nr:CinA family nicotinamide mononucleotide deamidase-related protein [Planctomycetota bacterium]